MIDFAAYTPDAHGVPLDAIEVRTARDADIEGCADLVALREGGEVEHWARRIRYWLASGQKVFVAVLGSRVVGYSRLAWLTPVADGGRRAPDGLYLSGIMVDPRYRRCGIGRSLTQIRLDWARGLGQSVFFVVNALNHASMDLHRELGFRELTRDFDLPGVTFTGGEGVLFMADASGEWQQVTQLRVRPTR